MRVEVFFFVPQADMEDVIQCGLKLSKWATRQVRMNGQESLCIRALLNPKDDADKYHSPDFRCLKLDVPPEKCWVAEGYFHQAGMENLYLGSLIEVKSYLFGTYRLPECLIPTTVLPGNIRRLDRRRDIPVLYNSSEELYLNNVMESQKEQYGFFHDGILYCWFEKLRSLKKMARLPSSDPHVAVFTDCESGKVYLVRIPAQFT